MPRPPLARLVTVLLLLAPTVAAGQDATADRLEKAKAKFEADRQKVRDDFKRYADAREADARKAAKDNKALLDKVADERKAFDQYGILGEKAPRDLKTRAKASADAIEKAYKDAANEYTRAKKDDLADGARAEWELLKTNGLLVVAPPGELWLSLFNGRDLTGWAEHVGNKTKWQVADKTIQATGGNGMTMLRTKTSFSDFHLRFEYSYTADADSRLCFRESVRGYQNVQLIGGAKTGTFGRSPKDVTSGYISDGLRVTPPVNEWVKMEVIARGKTLTAVINEDTKIECRDDVSTTVRGPILLEVAGAASVVRFRNIDILPLAPPPAAVPAKNPPPKK